MSWLADNRTLLIRLAVRGVTYLMRMVSMAFRVPTFPLTVAIWRSTSLVTNPPDAVTVGNLVASRPEAEPLPAIGVGTLAQRQVVAAYWGRFATILFPKLTDVRPPNSTTDADVVECPAGSKRYYWVTWVDDAGKGFANEHRYAYVVALQTPAVVGLFGNPCGITAAWPTPVP